MPKDNTSSHYVCNSTSKQYQRPGPHRQFAVVKSFRQRRSRRSGTSEFNRRYWLCFSVLSFFCISSDGTVSTLDVSVAFLLSHCTAQLRLDYKELQSRAITSIIFKLIQGLVKFSYLIYAGQVFVKRLLWKWLLTRRKVNRDPEFWIQNIPIIPPRLGDDKNRAFMILNLGSNQFSKFIVF